MPFFDFLNDDASLEDIAEHRFDRYKHFISLSEDIMRAESSELEPAQREIIAALVSGTNECSYCFGAHIKIAEAFGLDEGLMAKLLDNIDSAPVESRLKSLLKFVKKLSSEPQKLTQRDADEVFDAGWTEAALEDAIAVCALFNFANRLVQGHGLENIWSDKRQQHLDNLINKGYSS